MKEFHPSNMDFLKKNKPSPNFTYANVRNINYHSISQKAMQTWCLIRVFPFLVSDKVPKGERHMELITLFLRIMEIVFAPKINKSLRPYLSHLIKDLFEMFKKLFPDINFINKFHHLLHYVECIKWSGPLINFWCMKFELKHGQLKERSHVMHNYRNCPKTLLRICQCTQSAQWGGQDMEINIILAYGGKTVEVQDTFSRQELLNFGFIDTDNVFRTNSVNVNGTEYRNEVVVCVAAATTSDDNLPIFGEIKEIIILEQNSIYLKLTLCESLYFDIDFNAYSIQLGDLNGPTSFTLVANLAHYKPLSI